MCISVFVTSNTHVVHTIQPSRGLSRRRGLKHSSLICKLHIRVYYTAQGYYHCIILLYFKNISPNIKIYGHCEVLPVEQTAKKDPQRVRAFDDGLIDTAVHIIGTHEHYFPFILASLKGPDSSKAQGIPYLLYIFSKIRTTVKMMMTTTTMAATMAPEPTRKRGVEMANVQTEMQGRIRRLGGRHNTWHPHWVKERREREILAYSLLTPGQSHI